jgi:hypothetical protein
MSKKNAINCFLVIWLLTLAIDAAPELGGWHKKLKENLDPYLDVTGLWQGEWKLFAPEPDKINVAITADITFSDGREVAWRSPDWRSQSTWQRFLSFREAEFIDNVRKDGNAGAWPTFADYLGRTVLHPEHPELKPTKIVLTRHWHLVPPPSPENIHQFPEVPEMDSSHIFFAKDFQP